MTTAIICPKHYACQEGSEEPRKCPGLHSSAAGSDSCYAEIGLYIVILGCIAAVIIGAIIGIKFYVGYKRKLAKRLDRQLEIEKLIPHSDGPVYSGL